ncbi:hypothetical protein [Mechercharimyces sp. CAU 1602]|uniref:hypothetical protein n=1 Tax=Mechercharimyces sp. CAU 1602 TaxID=2973933 RepID=UPI002161470B|nr:hypothetical protein [Mechercharimyces sp. CAU 1602]MCS1350174.1 hypothetical protein [Mechercharimyces sp. CAU 1602]
MLKLRMPDVGPIREPEITSPVEPETTTPEQPEPVREDPVPTDPKRTKKTNKGTKQRVIYPLLR